MILALDRGILPAPKPEQNIDLRVYCHLETHTAMFCEKGKAPSSLTVHGKNIFFGFSTFDNANVWQKLFLKEKDFMYVPAWGWLGEQWFDGPLLHVIRGKIANFVPHGSPARLIIDAKTTANFQMRDLPEDHVLLVESLIGAASKLASDEQKTINLMISELSPQNAVALTLFRKAHLNKTIFLLCEVDYKSWPSPWKRLSQNLGIEMYERAALKDGQEVSLSPLTNLIKENWFAPFLKILNAKSQLIPEELARGAKLGRVK